MNNKGITLVELIIYIVLTGFVITLISSPFKTMLKSSAANKEISQIQSSSRDALSMLSREIRNTGLKRYPMSGSGPFNSAVIPNTYLLDSSSFSVKPGNPSDTLTIYKARVNDLGQCTGEADSVKFYLQDNTLKRVFNGTPNDLAQDVHALQFQTGLFTKDSMLYSCDTFFSSQWTRSGTVSGVSIESNNLLINFTGAGSGAVSSVKTFSINPAARIKVRFTLVNKSGIPDNIESIQWGIVNSFNSVIASENFKAGLSGGELIIPVSSVSNARIQLKAVSKAAASLVIDKFELKAIDRGLIVWSDTVAVKEKKNVKALKIYVLLRTNGKTDTQKNGPVNVANISIDRSGMYSWRLLSETVEISNNGLF